MAMLHDYTVLWSNAPFRVDFVLDMFDERH